MKKLFFRWILLVVAISGITSAYAQRQTGVWVSNDAELLLTDKVMMYFEKQSDDCVNVTLIVNDVTKESVKFSKDSVIRGAIPADFNFEFTSDKNVKVNGRKLIKAEEFEMCEPYDMPIATDKKSIGKRLSEWRLGTIIEFDETTKDIYVEVNTPKNMFLYYILKDTNYYYLRAARIENVNEGSLFCQNIRLMQQPATSGEFTLYFSPRNKQDVMGKIDINLDAFNPDACYSDPNGGIYWSYTSHTPNQIVLNGCDGDTYYINRRLKSHNYVQEWIKHTN